jgi:hypothetical protein
LVFGELDTSGNGRLDMDEVRAGAHKPQLQAIMRRYNIQVEELVQALDGNGDGTVSVLEFLRGMSTLLSPTAPHVLAPLATRPSTGSLHDVSVAAGEMVLNDTSPLAPRVTTGAKVTFGDHHMGSEPPTVESTPPPSRRRTEWQLEEGESGALPTVSLEAPTYLDADTFEDDDDDWSKTVGEPIRQLCLLWLDVRGW